MELIEKDVKNKLLEELHNSLLRIKKEYILM